jgi:hypothetical protein
MYSLQNHIADLFHARAQKGLRCECLPNQSRGRPTPTISVVFTSAPAPWPLPVHFGLNMITDGIDGTRAAKLVKYSMSPSYF